MSQQSSPPMKDGDAQTKTLKYLTLFLIILIVISPLGLLAIGTAFGEWGSDELLESLGYVPVGIENGETIWRAPMIDYGFGSLSPSVGYILSAVIGIGLVIAIMVVFGKLLTKKQNAQNQTPK